MLKARAVAARAKARKVRQAEMMIIEAVVRGTDPLACIVEIDIEDATILIMTVTDMTMQEITIRKMDLLLILRVQ
jgi:hypothetical protein